MNRENLELVVREALNMVFARDGALLDNNSSEWSVAHRIAVYLEQFLPGWNIDCEYNRQGEMGHQKERAGGKRVRPDIIIYHRGRMAKEHNLLAIELKKGHSEADEVKVREYTSTPDENRRFQYRYGLLLALNECHMTWYENGQIAK